jgi:hypothetical protein
MRHLTRRDQAASAFVALATIAYLAWLAGAELPGLSSVRAETAAVLALGFAASASAVVPGFEGLIHGSKTYVGLMSLVGAGALVAGILALVTESEGWLGVLVVTTVVMWFVSTVRHAMRSATTGHPAVT